MDFERSYSEIHEECGVFAAFGVRDAARQTFIALQELQHRGQQGCGIAALGPDGQIRLKKGAGLVRQVFDEGDLDALPGTSCIGHVRYPTTDVGGPENLQPFRMTDHLGPFAVAHNGNLVNADEIRARLENERHLLLSTSDSELIGHLIGHNGSAEDRQQGILSAVQLLDGAFCVVVLTPDALYAFRDRHGFHPLSLGRTQEGYLVASETCAFRESGARYLRDVEPGELVCLDREGLHSYRFAQERTPHFCAMELIYFARPDSRIGDRSVYSFRKETGHLLWKECPLEADLVTAIPESAYAAALGYAEVSGIPYETAFFKNAYIARTFIQPAQHMRDLGVRMKLSPIGRLIEGKRIVVIDDSIVRGTTSRQIVRLLKDAGAREVHMAIASPPYAWPCFYGIDTGTREELIAARLNPEAIRQFIGADSLHYLPEKALSEAARTAGLCTACFSGRYPTELYGHRWTEE